MGARANGTAIPARGFSPGEMMVAAASREIRPGEVVFVGMRLPLLAFLVARGGGAPGAVGVFENGLVRVTAAERGFTTMGDPPNVHGALMAGPMSRAMDLLQGGRVSLGLVGGAEVDAWGNVNTVRVGAGVRLPGSGGAADIASLAGRLVVVMRHEPRRFVERVAHLTSPGFGSGGDWRARSGLPGGGPAAVITDLCVLRFDPMSRRAVVASLHEGATMDLVSRRTGFALECAPDAGTTPPPTAAELALIRQYDPGGFWTGERSAEEK